MEDFKTPVELKLEQMEKYVREWLVNPTVAVMPVIGHNDEEAYSISQGEDVIYLAIFKKGECKRDSIVTTSGIIDDELRGCVEKCIYLDIKLAEKRANKLATQNGNQQTNA